MQKNLSYIIATYNKLPYLKISLEKICTNKLDDEEIIVVDGGSSDGTSVYLKEMLDAGKIDDFVSEPDLGEGHADNKGIHISNGNLIKVITDDDAFHLPSIRECKQFMLENPEIDALSTDGIKARTHQTYPFSSMFHESKFKTRLKRGTSFASCGLGLMIRRSSLPILGYFDPAFMRMDAEYTLRITAGKAKLAWYTRESYAHILNTQSNSHTNEKRIKEELERLETFYFPSKFYIPLKQKIRNFVQSLVSKKQHTTKDKTDEVAVFESWSKIFEESNKWLDKNASANNGQFIH